MHCATSTSLISKTQMQKMNARKEFCANLKNSLNLQEVRKDSEFFCSTSRELSPEMSIITISRKGTRIRISMLLAPKEKLTSRGRFLPPIAGVQNLDLGLSAVSTPRDHTNR